MDTLEHVLRHRVRSECTSDHAVHTHRKPPERTLRPFGDEVGAVYTMQCTYSQSTGFDVFSHRTTA
eukprot:4360095-Prymnesium_polylepis.1